MVFGGWRRCSWGRGGVFRANVVREKLGHFFSKRKNDLVGNKNIRKIDDGKNSPVILLEKRGKVWPEKQKTGWWLGIIQIYLVFLRINLEMN